MKKVILLVILLVFMLTGCAALPTKLTTYKEITLCGVNPTDCLTFAIPSEYPDFVNEFEENVFCVGDFIMVTCSWWDGETREDKSVPTAKWYTVGFWTSGRVSDTTPVMLEYSDIVEHKHIEDTYFIYSKNQMPEQVTEYEYYKYLYGIYGTPIGTEEEYYKQKEEAQKEFQRMLEEAEKEQSCPGCEES